MSKKKNPFQDVLEGKRIPVLTLDNQWHQIFTHMEPNKAIRALEEELNDLLKQQGKANTETKDIKKLKKKLMDEIVVLADEAANGNNPQSEKKLEENKRLINECNEKTNEYEELLLELPRQIDSVNKQLMLETMELCYNTMKKNRNEIEETAKWIAGVRVELKKKLIRKQEQEQTNQDIYTYMNNVFGPEVINLFDAEWEE